MSGTMLDFQTLLFETLSHHFADRIRSEQERNTQNRPIYVTSLSQFSIFFLHVKGNIPRLHGVFMVLVGWILGR